jgi:hypothetical protein
LVNSMMIVHFARTLNNAVYYHVFAHKFFPSSTLITIIQNFPFE